MCTYIYGLLVLSNSIRLVTRIHYFSITPTAKRNVRISAMLLVYVIHQYHLHNCRTIFPGSLPCSFQGLIQRHQHRYCSFVRRSTLLLWMIIGNENTQRMSGLKWKDILAGFYETQSFHKLKKRRHIDKHTLKCTEW
jgi:hypothetical protein